MSAPLDGLSGKTSNPELDECFALTHVIDRFRDVTDKISTQVRTVSLGMLIFVWSLLSATPATKLAKAASDLEGWIGLVALFSVLALIADYMQYVLGLLVVNVTRANKIHQKTKIYRWPTNTILYKSQFWFFWAKQLMCGIGVLLVIIIVVLGFLI